MTAENVKRALKFIGIPLLVAFVIKYFFGVADWKSLFGVMTITFFISLPYIVGVLAIYFSKEEKVVKLAYRIFMPWIPIFLFFIITLVFSIEGWACWIMILPIFLIFASLGGLTAGYYKMKKSRGANHVHISLAVLLPFFIAPIEHLIGTIPGFYEAYTYIDIDSSKEKIWSNVTKVSEISLGEDKGRITNFLQIPRPIKAELDFEGVGASRKAIFSGGLVFDEKVLKYEHQQLMNFSIKANTFEIPSTTFDEHILIGGEFFDVLQGTYRLENIGPNKYRLHLVSEFKLNTTFNFYASIWGRLIMKDIQENILKIIKARSEKR